MIIVQIVKRQNGWIYQQLVEGVSHLRRAEHQDGEAVPENTKNPDNHLKRKQRANFFSFDNNLKCLEIFGTYLKRKHALLIVKFKMWFEWYPIEELDFEWLIVRDEAVNKIFFNSRVNRLWEFPNSNLNAIPSQVWVLTIGFKNVS